MRRNVDKRSSAAINSGRDGIVVCDYKRDDDPEPKPCTRCAYRGMQCRPANYLYCLSPSYVYHQEYKAYHNLPRPKVKVSAAYPTYTRLLTNSTGRYPTAGRAGDHRQGLRPYKTI
jgi:hypothetical protein